jgi:hypothetical protein
MLCRSVPTGRMDHTETGVFARSQQQGELRDRFTLDYVIIVTNSDAVEFVFLPTQSCIACPMPSG